MVESWQVVHSSLSRSSLALSLCALVPWSWFIVAETAPLHACDEIRRPRVRQEAIRFLA